MDKNQPIYRIGVRADSVDEALRRAKKKFEKWLEVDKRTTRFFTLRLVATVATFDAERKDWLLTFYRFEVFEEK